MLSIVEADAKEAVPTSKTRNEARHSKIGLQLITLISFLAVVKALRRRAAVFIGNNVAGYQLGVSFGL